MNKDIMSNEINKALGEMSISPQVLEDSGYNRYSDSEIRKKLDKIE